MSFVAILSHRKLAGLALGIALSGVSVSSFAQSRDWATIVVDAKKEGHVAIYSNMVPPVNQALKAAFESANPGITLEIARVIGPAAAQKLMQEKQAATEGGDGVITVEQLWLETNAKEGAFMKPVGPAMQNWPAKYLIGGSAPILGLEPWIIAYNTDLVKQPITGYGDFLRPEFKGGKIGGSELSASALVAWYDWLEKTQGNDYLVKLAAQQPKLYVGAGQSTQAAASGEVEIAGFSIPSIVNSLRESGAHLKEVVTNPAIGNEYGFAAVTWSRHPNAALVLLDFLMSDKGQAVLCSHGEMACALPNIPGSLNADSITPYDQNLYTPEFSKAYAERWNKLFKAH